MRPFGLSTSDFLQLLTAALLFATAVISVLVGITRSIIRWHRYRRLKQRSRHENNSPAKLQLETPDAQPENLNTTPKTSDTSHAKYEAGYQTNKDENYPLQQKQQGR